MVAKTTRGAWCGKNSSFVSLEPKVMNTLEYFWGYVDEVGRDVVDLMSVGAPLYLLDARSREDPPLMV